MLEPAELEPAVLGWVACGGGHSISTRSGADENFCCGAAEMVVQPHVDDSVGVTTVGSRALLEPLELVL